MRKIFLISIIAFITIFACKKDESQVFSSISGKVIIDDELNIARPSDAVSGAMVTLYEGNIAKYQCKTSNDGTFKLDNVESGDYSIGAYHSYFKESKRKPVSINSEDELVFTFEPDEVSVSGVYSAIDGTPIYNAAVQLTISRNWNSQKSVDFDNVLETGQTDLNGQFYFFSIEPGTYELVFIAAGYETAKHLVKIGANGAASSISKTGILAKDDDAPGDGGDGDSEEPLETFTDSRDGKVYKQVQIGNQIWMAENLAYLPQVDKLADGAEDDGYTGKYYYVYGFNPDNLDDEDTQIAKAKLTDNYQTYGVLYSWPAAINGESASTSTPSNRQGACPDGWHLPSYNEFYNLRNYIERDLGYVSGSALKSQGNTTDGNGLWVKTSYPGKDFVNFNGVPAGRRQWNGSSFSYLGNYGRFWTSSQRDWYRAYYMYLHYNASSFYGASSSNKSYGWSVRCVKD